MASHAGNAPDAVALENALRDKPEAFDFLEAARLLECAHPDRPLLGRSAKASDDFVRLCQTPTLAFAPRAIDRYQPASAGKPARLYGLFFGLFGPNAPLPLHLTEYALDRQINAKDHTLSAFADIFHHRMMSLFYRSWADAQPTVQLDRPQEDRFKHYMGAFVGLATPNLDSRDALPDQFKRFFAGRLLQQTRNAEGLKGLLERFFRIPVAVVEFVAEWMRLPPTAHLRLGASTEVAALGLTAVTGEYVWGSQQRFRLRLGPLSREQFNNFLPGGTALDELVAAVKTYVGEEKAWDLQLVLKHSDVPVTQLGRNVRMGLTTWMGGRQSHADADEVILKPVG
ncbi:type VI secretion system baseplate subunit TssG [Rhodanobacter sp. AS-Z3]|uniref:type VI secretion system baseplate subunit TssG n=1 Tax=Rhodanobacter sp. AS-Z3 TaxID=3031330 RepID=UPI0024785B1F|nr:type VI secretion system baseplate subunit TssG [Rhodanobacter sp. AS-Z3]WEN14487.1 type VI secretion system baseplate subunit TssG [Rhodanobacter sp. AS-Z3]